MMQKQQGFTLLELLVVITLLAVLSVGALVAYEGIGDNAQATAAANNTGTVDSVIRTYKAVSLNYPDQWDNLSNAAAASPYDATQVAAATQTAFGDWAIPAASGAGTVRTKLIDAFNAVGINAIQQVTTAAAGVAPNLQHNEGSNPTGAAEVLLSNAALQHISILPFGNDATNLPVPACKAGGVAINQNYAGDNTTNFAAKANSINDSLQTDECQLVIALGFGHDAAHSTAGSPAAIVTAASYSSKNVNPANNYARYVALFHMGTDGDGDGDIVATEMHNKPHLLAIVDTEGNSIDANLAKATAAN